MNELFVTCLIICPLIFLSGFIDSVAGGGGLISLPAYLLAGFPPHIAAGTNKVVAGLGTATASIQYFKSGKILLNIALISAAGAIIGSALGTKLALFIPEKMLGWIFLIVLPMAAIFLATRKNFGREDQTPKEYSALKQSVISLLIGFFIGGYDGLVVVPGTGTFMILAFAGLLGLDLLMSSGCAKVSNFASNITSAILFAFSGKVMFAVVIPAAICCILGSYAGSRYAIKGGSAKVKKVMYVVLALMFLKFASDFLH